uniref:Zgc:158258 n=1 Tax=Cyclopterus lumpus TaxID=8103 RepID=A0A8C2WEN5_CYCLU
MPKSDTWPGGIGLETMTGMDSAGSWDSVLSANSVFSDDSMEHLSAEEKACLMFLEETIESLENEEDSGLSNDEPDQLPGPGNLANKLADLSASMSKSESLSGDPVLSFPLSGLQKHASKEPVQDFVDTKPMQGYLVPTPLVLASSAPCSALNAKTGVPPDKNLSYKPHFSPPSNKPDLHQKPVAPRVPLEVNGVMPPPTKPRDYSVRKAEGLPRGPLSYEALVHLRRSASTKKTPLCPAIDHTIDLDKIPANISVKTQNEASVTSDPPFNIKNASDPQVVRLEALQKLGLLRDQEPEKESVVPPPPKSHFSLDPTPNRFTRGPPHVNPSRSPSFCHSQVPTEPKNRPLQSSVSFHHYSRSDQQPAAASEPAQSNGFKATGLERSATLDNHRNGQPATRKPSTSVGYTVMVVPGMGADRKEALRKLGLLKD